MPLSSLFTKTSPERKKAKLELFKQKVSNLFQGDGNIQVISTHLTQDGYEVLKKEYDPLLKKIQDDQSLLVDLNKSLAIIAFRANSKDASTYLKAWEQSANADDFKTELQTILEGRIKFLQETGNITKGNEPLGLSEYKSSKSIYDSLVKTIMDYSLSDEIKTKLSFDLNKCQAISAVRAGKPADQDASTYLKACGSISANRNDFIIELYKIIELHKKVANNVQNPELKITTQLYKPLLEQAFEAVDSYLNSNNYEAALDEITPLIRNANSVLTLAKYIQICIKGAIPEKLEECWNQCLMTTSSTIEKSKTLAGIFEDLHKTFESLGNADTKTKAKYEDIAKQAKARAIQYTPQKEEVQVPPTVILTPAQQKAYEELKKVTDKKKKTDMQFVNAGAQVAEIEVKNECKAQLEAETAKIRAKFKVEAAEIMAKLEAKETQQIAQIKSKQDAELAAIHGQGSSTKDTPVTTSDSSNVVEASAPSKASVFADSDSSNVVAVSNFSKVYVRIYPLLDDVVADDIAAADPTATNDKTAVEETVGANAPNTLVDTVINLLNSNDSNNKEVYKIFIESCKLNPIPSEENYQLLKAIAEKTTDTNIQLDALTAAKSQTNNQKQQAELFLSKGKILLSLGKKDQASYEFGEAATYNHDIYKDVAEETLKSLYESGNQAIGYWYLSKTHNFNHKDPSIATKLAEFSKYMNSIHGIPGEAACLIKAYLCAPNANALVQVKNDLSIIRHIPYAADYYKDCCAINNNPAQMETYLQGIVQVIDEHM